MQETTKVINSGKSDLHDDLIKGFIKMLQAVLIMVHPSGLNNMGSSLLVCQKISHYGSGIECPVSFLCRSHCFGVVILLVTE